MSWGLGVLFLLAFLSFFATVICLLLLLVDSLYARSGVERWLMPSNGRQWAPEEDIATQPLVGRTAFPDGVRARLWQVTLTMLAVGCLALLLSSI